MFIINVFALINFENLIESKRLTEFILSKLMLFDGDLTLLKLSFSLSIIMLLIASTEYD